MDDVDMYGCQWNWVTVFLDEADRSSSMNSEVYRAVLSAQLQRNVAKQVGQQMDNDPKDNADILTNNNILQWPSHSPDLSSAEHAFYLLDSLNLISVQVYLHSTKAQ